MKNAFAPRYRPFWLLGVAALAVGVYALFWFSWLGEFKAALNAATMRATSPVQIKADDISYGGFPYRLEAEFKNARITRQQSDYHLEITTPSLVIERQPWRPQLHIGFLDHPRFTLNAPQLMGGLKIDGRSASGQFSLKLKKQSVERLSLVLDEALFNGKGWLTPALKAKTLEFHGRETAAIPQAPRAPGDKNPTAPAFLELVLRGDGVWLGKGEGGSMLASLSVTSDPKITAGTSFLEAWRQSGGTLEVLSFSLGDKEPLITAAATFALNKQLQLIGSGTVTSPCPQTLQQAVRAPSVALAERRLRQPVAMGLRLEGGVLSLLPPEVQGQGPAQSRGDQCPGLRQ